MVDDSIENIMTTGLAIGAYGITMQATERMLNPNKQGKKKGKKDKQNKKSKRYIPDFDN